MEIKRGAGRRNIRKHFVYPVSLLEDRKTAESPGTRHSVIRIDQVLLPDPHELLQTRLIVLGNTPRIFAGLKLRQGQIISQQLDQ